MQDTVGYCSAPSRTTPWSSLARRLR